MKSLRSWTSLGLLGFKTLAVCGIFWGLVCWRRPRWPLWSVWPGCWRTCPWRLFSNEEAHSAHWVSASPSKVQDGGEAEDAHWVSIWSQGIGEGRCQTSWGGHDRGMWSPTVIVECSAKTSAMSTIRQRAIASGLSQIMSLSVACLQVKTFCCPQKASAKSWADCHPSWRQSAKTERSVGPALKSPPTKRGPVPPRTISVVTMPSRLVSP